MDALDDAGIPYYNPRSKGLLDDQKIQIMLGGLLQIIDPNSSAQQMVLFKSIKEKCNQWRLEFDEFGNKNQKLRDYVNRYAESIKSIGPRTSVGVNLLELFYDLLNYYPLSEWIDDPEISQKLGTICKTLNSYSNVPSSNNTKIMLGSLYTSSKPYEGISFTWRKNFYYSLLGILASEGLNEAEDEIENFPRGKVPIMTIHQSKGLEFPVFFIHGLSSDFNSEKNVETELAFAKFRTKISGMGNKFSKEDKIVQDDIRLYYVAYSRAQYALILLTTDKDYRKPGVGMGRENGSVFQNAIEI
jgi:DNA helicase-2/ATP-dependent DNA helicase PcrA